MNYRPAPSHAARVTTRVCDLLDFAQSRPEGFTLQEAAQVAGLPRSTTLRFLFTLGQRHYVTRDEDRAFHVGPSLLPPPERKLNALTDQVRPHLARLRDRFAETVYLGSLDGHRVSFAEVIESPHTVRAAVRRGTRERIHCTALGKAIASTLDSPQVTAILDADGMPEHTPTTITTVEAYHQELDRVRAQGYAVDDCECDPDGRCVAVPLSHVGLPAAICLAAPASRLPLDQCEPVARALMECASVIEVISVPLPFADGAGEPSA